MLNERSLKQGSINEYNLYKIFISNKILRILLGKSDTEQLQQHIIEVPWDLF